MKDFLRWLADLGGRFARTLDWPMCLALGALMVIGLAVLKSAGGQAGGNHLMLAQAMRFAIGAAAMWGLSRVSALRLRAWTPLIYALSMLPLLAVFALGTGKYGRQWLDLKVFYLQPAELLKISMPMMVAWYLHRVPLPPRVPTVLVSAVIIGLPTALIMLQPDFGTGVLIAASGGFVLLLAGLPWWWVGIAVGGVAAAAPVAWLWLLRPYQKDRIMMFLNPENDALGAGWNIIQSKIAIGSGGLHGKGWGLGSQSHLNFIPEQTTDFAFSVLSEEFGWIGVATVLTLYLVVIARCLWIAAQARDTFSRLLAGATGLAFFVYVLVNGGMISGLLPVVGVPMPLMSYGGTSAVSLLAGLGLVMAVKAHRPVHGY
ncbi:rod shape-determining protein RodA [Xanthomonas sp. GW]|uniref:rod shape-determining protein RodA n=1 Tax=unclassified Xanthomonas TaxID=2643310 RepID=UPI00163AE655|nr:MULTISPECIES: rod shape-determining protein RodA [unclassified Xanthomonas]QNH18203.1 rod shape-determining protein RodA [Xanthomonas sp. SS]QNH19865.1 rod shape-determining protein RodA [Xanthomonas sp. GW]